jgi:hypothetical protein
MKIQFSLLPFKVGVPFQQMTTETLRGRMKAIVLKIVLIMKTYMFKDIQAMELGWEVISKLMMIKVVKGKLILPFQ